MGSCPNCAHENRDGARFCEECGGTLAAAPSPSEAGHSLPTTVGEDRLVREAVAGHGGTVVKSAGDGYMIVFPAASAAVACALGLQRAHDGHDFGFDVGAIRVRIGTHVGEVIREGDDFFGRTVILAARVAAQATGGEILVSDALVQVAGDPAEVGGKFGPPRAVELKGIRGTQMVHPLEW